MGKDYGRLDFDAIRSACAEVAARARHVRIRPAGLTALARSLSTAGAPAPHFDTEHHYLGRRDETAAYVLTLDSVNFGSGYFPHLLKRPGMSGYFTIAYRLKRRFETDGALTADELCALEVTRCAGLLGQDLKDPVRSELLALYTRALVDLGVFVKERFDGSFTALIEAADGSAARLGGLLGEMPFFRDIAAYHGFEVPLFKRAQIAASDLALAFGGQDLGAFHDLKRLTIFADNLVPHVLRIDGALEFDAALAARIEAGQLLEAGSEEEVEIRAVALHAVEKMVELLSREGRDVCARDLDVALWNRGQQSRYKRFKRHRTRTVYY